MKSSHVSHPNFEVIMSVNRLQLSITVQLQVADICVTTSPFLVLAPLPGLLIVYNILSYVFEIQTFSLFLNFFVTFHISSVP